jgi:TIR domain
VAPNIFISFASTDGILAGEVFTDLKKAGGSVWQFDESAIPGTDSWGPILDIIKNADYFLVLWSASAAKSIPVEEELPALTMPV